MSLAAFYAKKCQEILAENVQLTLDQLSSPSSFVNVEASGALADAAKGGLGGLSQFGEEYAKNNADRLILGGLAATGQENNVRGALDLAFNLMALALASQNNLVLVFLKDVAKKILVELDKKEEILEEVNALTTKLVNALISLRAGDPIFDEYLEDLRTALVNINQAKSNITLVRNTLDSRNFFLSTRFSTAQEQLNIADQLIKPLEENPYLAQNFGSSNKTIVSEQSDGIADPQQPTLLRQTDNERFKDVKEGDRLSISDSPEQPDRVIPGDYTVKAVLNERFLTVDRAFITGDEAVSSLKYSVRKPNATGVFLSANFGIPTREQQLQTILTIPALTRDLVAASQGYLESTVLANGLIESYFLGLEQLSSSLPGLLKKYVVSLLDTSIDDMNVLEDNMADLLNGSPERITAPLPGFTPQAQTVSVNAYKWALQLNLILSFLKQVPEETLTNVNLADGPVRVYNDSLKRLRLIDNLTSGAATVFGEDGKEEATVLEQQLLQLMLQANAGILSADVNEQAINLGKTIVERNELVVSRDARVRSALQAFIDTPIPEEDTLRQLADSIKAAFSSLGLDKASDLLSSGKFTELFSIQSGREATFVGAALLTVGLLRECFDTTEQAAALDEINNDLRREEDLLNVDISLNFSLAILNNIDECIEFGNKATQLSLQELLCGLLDDLGAGSAMNRLRDLVAI